LDLDAWIVPSEALESLEEVVGSEEPQVKKSRKGKEKESNGKARKGKKKRKEDSDVVIPPASVEVETTEDRAEAERVCDHLTVMCTCKLISRYYLSVKLKGWSGYGMIPIISWMQDP
jgi:hypothetical protein